MLDMNLQRFADQGPTTNIIIPNGFPDKPGPKLVSAKGKVEHLVVVLDEEENLKAATQRVLKDGNVPALLLPNGILMTGSMDRYIGFGFFSDTELLFCVGKFDDKGALNITTYIVTIAKQTIG